MNLFERYLSLWVLLCILTGITLGHFFTDFFQLIGALEYAHINFPIAILVWIMIIPMLLRIDLAALKNVRKHWRGVGVTLFINWAIKPFSMALFAWLTIGFAFKQWLPEDQINSYIAGLIILAAAPCTAMVFVWSNLTKGEPHFTLSQVALNDIIMIFAFAPIVGLLLGLSAITIPWDTLLLSIVIYITIPLLIATVIRKTFLNKGKTKQFEKLLTTLQPWSTISLLTTLVLIFGFQGKQIISQPFIILLLAIPILFQVILNSSLAYYLNRLFRTPHCIAAPSALIGASNFFELAVATAIAMFGFESGAALATVVGVLIEVPIMLVIVKVVNKTRPWYERPSEIPSHEECCPTLK